jgi:beta-phosphoglucomutase-like phosphatase (HAD superfamily)
MTLYEDYQQIFMKNIEDNIVPRPGLIESLQMFKDYEFKLAITSTGSRDYIYLVTEVLDIEEAFDVIVAGDMVSQGYPNPTYMSACAETFALHPSDCLAFTCRRDGIEAATTAGMKTICIPGYNTPRWKAVGADLVLPYLSDINLNTVRGLWTESSDELRPQPQLFPHLGR